MNSYRDQLQEAVGTSLDALYDEQNKVLSHEIASQYNLYYAQGALLNAEDHLTTTNTLLEHSKAVNQQGVENDNLAFNLVNSTNDIQTNSATTETNTATAASNIQAAATAITKLAADVGGAMNIATASCYGKEIYQKTVVANSFIRQTANLAEHAAQLAMEASYKSAEVISKELVASGTKSKANLETLLSATTAEFDALAKEKVADQTDVAAASVKEKKSEGSLEDAHQESIAIDSSVNCSNKSLNFDLSAKGELVFSLESFAFENVLLSNFQPYHQAFTALPNSCASLLNPRNALIPPAIGPTPPQYYVFAVKADQKANIKADHIDSLFNEFSPEESAEAKTPARFVAAFNGEMVLKDFETLMEDVKESQKNSQSNTATFNTYFKQFVQILNRISLLVKASPDSSQSIVNAAKTLDKSIRKEAEVTHAYTSDTSPIAKKCTSLLASILGASYILNSFKKLLEEIGKAISGFDQTLLADIPVYHKGNATPVNDIDGNPMTLGTEYATFIYAQLTMEYKQYINIYENLLSSSSAGTTVTSLLPEATGIGLTLAKQASSFGKVTFSATGLPDGADCRVMLLPTKAVNYGEMLTSFPKSTGAAGTTPDGLGFLFNVLIAEQISPANYLSKTVSSGTTSFSVDIPDDATDNFGGPIDVNGDYIPAVLTTMPNSDEYSSNLAYGTQQSSSDTVTASGAASTKSSGGAEAQTAKSPETVSDAKDQKQTPIQKIAKPTTAKTAAKK